MYTITRLARRFGLSRSTLLYYDSIGLLKPSTGGNGEYRRYSEEDAGRLEQICAYREAGLRLKEIREILDSPRNDLSEILQRRLGELSEDVARIRRQQRLLVGLLRNERVRATVAPMSKELWVSLLEASGFSEEDMRRWHVEFERFAPDKHQQFLEYLCIPRKEIAKIRDWARNETG